jgi:catechol 2,3-dioxygenase-like lactoylglutathione lyase family enzyme
MLKLKAIDHVGLRVSDMDKTLHFYQQLGLALLRASGPGADGRRAAVIQVGSQEINLVSRPEFIASEENKHTGIDHFCLQVEATSFDGVIADLQRAGIDVGKGAEQRRDGTSVYLHDPDGVRVELLLKNATV